MSVHRDKSLVRFMGAKLVFGLLNSADGDQMRVFRSISKANTIMRASSGLYIYENVLWMRMLEVSEGMRMPNGAKWFGYVPFWKEAFPKGKRFYKFLLKEKEGKKSYEYHSF